MTAFLIIVAVLAVVVLLLIVFTPSKAVRDEPKLDKADEAKLLLHRNPDEPTGEYRAISTLPDGPDEETDPNATYEDLAKLDDEPGDDA